MSSLFERPLNKPIDQSLPNTLWTIVRAFLYVTAFLGLLAAVFMIIACRSRGSPSGAWWLATYISTALIMAMLLAAAISSFGASRGGQALAALRAGNYFVRWNFDAATWATYGAGEARTLRTVGWILALMAALTGVLLSYGLSVTPDTVRHKTHEIIIFDLCDIAFAVSVVMLSRFFGRWRQAALQRRPTVIIGPNAVYSGGDLLFWNAGGNALYSARLLWPGSSAGIAQLELVIGFSKGARNVAGLSDAALHLTGHAGLVSSYRVVRKFPVPKGQEQLAAQICTRLMQGEPVATPVRVPAAHALPAVARTAFKPTPARAAGRLEPRHAGRWWKITSSMIGVGVPMFCMLVFDEMRTSGHATKAAVVVGSLGAIIALAAVIPLSVAVSLRLRDLVNRA